MPAILIAFLTPILTHFLGLLGGGAIEAWVLDHAIPSLLAVIGKSLVLGSGWAVQVTAPEAGDGIVVVEILRSGQECVDVTIKTLALTGAHQATLAALLGAFFAQGEALLLAAFSKAAPAAKS
jgi:hypothetical protein